VATHREALEAIRDRLTNELALAEGRDVAAISKELRATWVELDAMPNPEGVRAPADEIARRREERRLKAAGE
jgi:hypothetical protein